MTVMELINRLQTYPPMMGVYIQTSETALNKVQYVEIDNNLGIVELKYDL